jgi:hypothetical protein
MKKFFFLVSIFIFFVPLLGANNTNIPVEEPEKNDESVEVVIPSTILQGQITI